MEQYSVMMRELPTEERPRERLWLYGPQALSVTELLAIILRVGVTGCSAVGLAQQLLSKYGGVRGLANASSHEMASHKGIGQTKAIQIAACVELGKRMAAYALDTRCAITSPEDAIQMLMPDMRDLQKEVVKSLHLDTKMRVIRMVTVSIGSLDTSVVHPREVFKDALQSSASSLIVAHNHPSGDPTPSSEDIQLTARLGEAGKVLGIGLMDHLIIGADRWISMKRQGYL
jgi:DNA repair protein RadC